MRDKVVGTNCTWYSTVPVSDVGPGSIVFFGIDDDMTCLLIANFEDTYIDGNGRQPCRHLVYLGMAPPGNYEHEKLIHQICSFSDTISVLVFAE